MPLSKETYRSLYEKLDTVFPVPFDCGTLCGKACCGVTEYNRPVPEDSMGIYLFPGEEELQREDPDWLYWEEEEDTILGDIWFVRCRAPLHCHRLHRPLQCRMFPLLPHLMPGNRLVLIWNDMDLPYACPILEQEAPISEEWMKAVYEVWETLLTEPSVLRMVQWESKERVEDLGPPTVLYPRFQTRG